jgi:hypothetical protein
MLNKLILMMLIGFWIVFLASCKSTSHSCAKRNKPVQCETVPVKKEQCPSAAIADANTIRILVENTNSSTTVVELRKVGSYYLGPKGERYEKLPSRELLASIYAW